MYEGEQMSRPSTAGDSHFISWLCHQIAHAESMRVGRRPDGPFAAPILRAIPSVSPVGNRPHSPSIRAGPFASLEAPAGVRMAVSTARPQGAKLNPLAATNTTR